MIFISLGGKRHGGKVVPAFENIEKLWAHHRIRRHRPEPIQAEFDGLAGTKRMTDLIAKCDRQLAKLKKKKPNPEKLKSICMIKAANQMLYWHTFEYYVGEKGASSRFKTFIKANIKKYGSILQTINDQA